MDKNVPLFKNRAEKRRWEKEHGKKVEVKAKTVTINAYELERIKQEIRDKAERAGREYAIKHISENLLYQFLWILHIRKDFERDDLSLIMSEWLELGDSVEKGYLTNQDIISAVNDIGIDLAGDNNNGLEHVEVDVTGVFARINGEKEQLVAGDPIEKLPCRNCSKLFITKHDNTTKVISCPHCSAYHEIRTYKNGKVTYGLLKREG